MLFQEIAYGPIHSRRLGCSLGVNLMPATAKVCSFNCVYCECGFNQPTHQPHIPTREEVKSALKNRLEALAHTLTKPDVITFSGNGEPTMHPNFEEVIADTCELRDLYFPNAKVSVLSNSTQLHRPDVVRGLHMADNRILKLDSAIDATMRLIDQPVNEHFSVDKLISQLQQFHGDLIVQTCFLRGKHGTKKIDNTTPLEIEAWLKALKKIAPRELMIYVIDRATPVPTLEKISRDEMEQIAQQARALGIEVSVSA